MPELNKSYYFHSSERGMYIEIYFPKRAAYYGTIFDALRDGYYEDKVKQYLRENVRQLINEFQAFPDLFSPHRYTRKPSRALPTQEEALQRIEMYKSPFNGWSIYDVSGVWFEKEKVVENNAEVEKVKMIEETTDIVRVMFRFESSFAQLAIDAGCFDVLRAIVFWTVFYHGRLYDHKIWGEAEKVQFMARHKPWPKKKRLFTEKHYVEIAREAGKWVDDRVIFVFAYLVRKFWENVVEKGLKEDEIWVAGFFDLVLNVIKQRKS